MPPNPRTRLLLLELVALLERTLAIHRTLSLPNAEMDSDELRGLSLLADDTLDRAHAALNESASSSTNEISPRHPLYFFGRSNLKSKMLARRAATAPPSQERRRLRP